MFSEISKDGVTYKTSPNISCPHAFTTRFGGVSSGIYSSLNLGINTGDDLKNIKSNYYKLCRALGLNTDEIVRSKQVHGTTVRIVTENDRGNLFIDNIPEADVMITNAKNTALIVYTADCVPILLHDPGKSVICAIHAGWRGTVADICGKAVKKMIDVYGCDPAHINAAIGPCISKCCFKTKKDVILPLTETLGDIADSCYKSIKNHEYLVDLKKVNKLLLNRVGALDILISEDCTSCDEKFWSHRKMNLQRGSQAAIISNS